jgi:fatty-acyl-CoA synthase
LDITPATGFVIEVLLPLLSWAALFYLVTLWAFKHWENRLTAKHPFRLKFPVSPMIFLSRKVVIEGLVNDSVIQSELHKIAEESGQPLSELEKKVRRQAKEIIPTFKAVFYFFIGYWLARLLLLTLYRARMVSDISDEYAMIGRDATVILFMNHRSNIDVLLVNYLLSGHSTVAHAAGEWARLWPLHHLVRMAGNFVVDRDANDALYRLVLRRFVQMAVSHGIHLGVFPEGELPRDGKILPLNLGLLNYIVTADWPGYDREVIFIPVSFNYDQIPEQERLVFEDQRRIRDRGKFYVVMSSLSFSFRFLLYILRPKNKEYGLACANFGEPISLKNWQRARGIELNSMTSKERRVQVEILGKQLMNVVSGKIPVLPIHLLATALIDDESGEWTESRLFQRAAELRSAMEAAGAPVFNDEQDWKQSFSEALSRLEKLGMVERQPDHSLSPVSSRKALLDYYANSIGHYLTPVHATYISRINAIEQVQLDERDRKYLQIMSDSYDRVLSREIDGKGFIEHFYQLFLASSPRVEEKFHGVDMAAQRLHLQHSLEHAVDYFISGKPSLRMKKIARIHSRAERDIVPELYELWLTSLLQAVVDYDEKCDSSVEICWRASMAPGIAYMTGQYAEDEVVQPEQVTDTSNDITDQGIAHWVDHWALRNPDKIALQSENNKLSYAELAHDAAMLASGLSKEYGIGEGDRVAILSHNRLEFITLIFACARLGAILVPVNWRLVLEEQNRLIDRAEVKVLFLSDAYLSSMCGEVKDYARITLDTNEKDMADSSYSELLSNATAPVCNSGKMSSPLFIIFTSGSTGEPKGAVLTQAAVYWNSLNSCVMHDMTRSDHIVTTLPFFHVGGINIQTLPALRVGASVSLITKFEAAEFVDYVQRKRPTLTTLVPAQMQLLMKLPDWHSADMSSFKAISTGSSIINKDLIRAWANKGVPVIQVYGCTESSPIAAHQTVEGIGPGLGTTGHAALYTEIKIADEQGNNVNQGSEGEILLSGPNIMSHYWRDDAATQAAFRDGWLLTGDLGYFDGNGRLCIVGRKKQLIISGGENIHPIEIEQVLERHPGIKEAAVVGIPDQQWGEIPVAVVIAANGYDLDEKDIRSHLNQHLGRYKHPRLFIITDQIPHTALGKIAYAEVSEQVNANMRA